MSHTAQAAVLAAGKGVRSVVLRLPMYVWGSNGSYFIPLNIAVAKQHGKAFYILPGWLPPQPWGHSLHARQRKPLFKLLIVSGPAILCPTVSR